YDKTTNALLWAAPVAPGLVTPNPGPKFLALDKRGHLWVTLPGADLSIPRPNEPHVHDDRVAEIDTETGTVILYLHLQDPAVPADDSGVEPFGICSIDNQIYVALKGQDRIARIDASLSSPKIANYVEVGRHPLWLTCHENRVYTSNFDSNSISVIEADQHSPNYDAVIRTISG